MPPVIAPGIVEFTQSGVANGRPWAMVLHMDIDTPALEERHEAIADQAKVLNNEWYDWIRPLCSVSTTMVGTRWVDLNAADGTTGSSVATDAPAVVPAVGIATGEPYGRAVAKLVKKHTASARGRRSGRIYLPGATETQIDGGAISAAHMTQLNTNMTAWRDAINQEGAGGGVFGPYDSRLVVLHVPASGVVSFDVVTSMGPESTLATQRRRQRS